MKVAAVNPIELLIWWEGRGGRRPLSHRELAAKLGISATTVRKRLRDLRAAGHVDDQARARHLATHGGLRRGGHSGHSTHPRKIANGPQIRRKTVL